MTMHTSDGRWNSGQDRLRPYYESTPFETQSSYQLKNALLADPSSFEAAFWLGVVLRNEGEVVQAADAAVRAVDLKPNDAAAHGSLASCFSLLNQPEKAIASLTRAIELDPFCSTYRHNLGNELERVGQIGEAVTSFREAIRLAPQLPYSYVSLGRILREKGQLTDAASCFDSAVSITLPDGKSQFELGRSFYDEGIVEYAERCLRRVVALEPEFADAQALLGTVLLQLGQFPEAGTVLERAIELRPKSARPYIELVESRKTKEEHRPFLESMNAMLSEGNLTAEDRRGLHYSLGKALEDLADYQSAIRHFDEANRMMMSQMPCEKGWEHLLRSRS